MLPDCHERQTRILIVDDEPVNLKLMERMLAGEGYANLVLVQDARQVVERYHQARPDLILLDINMPHLNGYEVMASLKSLNDPMLPPIVILTAQPSRDNLLRALQAGARDFVAKPFERVELLMRVKNLIEVQRAHRLLYEQKAVLEEMVQASTNELRQTRLQVVRHLGRAAEYRDNETGLHIIRMSQVSALLARSVGWSAERCELVLHASPMHDIGKIGIPDSILLKPSALTPQEFAVMRTHVSIGADMLASDDSELLKLAHAIALTHHEKWDGSGYPNGLAGEDIPLVGRIVAVADVFDALTSRRPYKEAWPVDDSVAYIKAQAGRHFDPAVVAQFELHWPEILAIREHHPDPVDEPE